MANFVTSRVFTLPALLLGGLSLSACSGHSYGQSVRYADINCDIPMSQQCGGYEAEYGAYGGQAIAKKTRYGSAQSIAGYEQYAYAPQQMMLRPAPMNYQQASYQAPSYTAATTSYSAVAADCPAGTTAQADGTCLQGSSYSYSSAAVSAPTYFPVEPAYSSSYISSGTSANCPAGTTAQSDGTCLQGGSIGYSSSSYSTPTFSSSSYSSSSSSVAPPISTHSFNDYNWGSNDTTWGSADYVSPGTRNVDSLNSYPEYSTPSYNTPSPSYWPTRK